MKLSRAVIFPAMALALLLAANVAGAQQYPPPAWTDILNQQGEFPPTMASGNYYNAGSGMQPVLNTDLAGIMPTASTLTLPANVTSLPASGGPVGCNATTNFPVAYIESNVGGAAVGDGGIKGVGFLGSFNSPQPFNNTPPNNFTGNIFESVFFNEDQCYGSTSGNQAREYGFFLATWDNSIWAYWGTNVNRTSPPSPTAAAVSQFTLPGIQANTQYYFEMYPVAVADAPGGCVIQIAVFLSNGALAYQSVQQVGDHQVTGNSILGTDSGFCAGVESDTGYVSANIEPSDPTVSGSIPALPDSRLNVNMQRVFVGKQ